MQTRTIGLWESTALVVGNMIGSGIFLLPAALAAFGGISILGWLFSAAGALCLARLFGYLSQELPQTGGPYAYSRKGLGDFAGFLVGWGYWISICSGNAAITTALVSYLSAFFPILETQRLLAVAAGLALIWGLTWVNARGVKEAAAVQVVTTILKVAPIVLLAIVGLFYTDWSHFVPFNRSGQSAFSAVTATATLTLWAFLGMESATVPAGNVRNPERTIPQATLLGTLITILVNIAGTVAVMGLVPPEVLADSPAPFADAAARIWGPVAHQLVAAAAVVATFGALNGWILMQGQVPMAVAADRLFPAIFARQGKSGAPVAGLLISSVLVSVVMPMYFTRGFVAAFQFIILLSTMTVLVPYVFSAAAYAVLVFQKNKLLRGRVVLRLVVTALAFAFSVWAIAGSGMEPVYWGFLLLLAGIPVYVWVKRG